MNILWFTWKDGRHPEAGGAETVNEELAKRLARDGHRVLFIVGGFPGGESNEERDGFEIIRLGNRYTVYWKAFLYYRKHLAKESFDIVIDEVNTIPFFTKYFTRAKHNIVLSYQLCREIWFYQMFFPLSLIGYLIEPLYLWLLRDSIVLTESMSSKRDFVRHGFREKNISVFDVGLSMPSISGIDTINKFANFTILSLGSMRAMKRTIHAVKGFEEARLCLQNLKLIVAGDDNSSYGRRVRRYVKKSPFRDDITFLGRISSEKKRELMQKSHVMCVTSIKEGWGLIVTEAASQGTPAVVYDVDGLRDAVNMGKSGILCEENTPHSIATNIIKLAQNDEYYRSVRKESHLFSSRFTLEHSYQSFLRALRRHKIC